MGIALRAVLSLPPKGKQALTFVLTAAPTEGEAVTRLIEMRREGRLTAANAAKSPFGGVEAQLAAQILPDLFYPPRMSREWAQAARENTRGQAALWAPRHLGDYPIVLIEVAQRGGRLPRRAVYAAAPLPPARRRGGRAGHPLPGGGRLRRARFWRRSREAAAAVGCTPMLGARGGIHAVNLLLYGEETAAFLTAVCVHNGARDLQRAGLPPVEYQPFCIQPVEKEGNIQKNGFAIPGGVFEKGEFRIEGSPRLPWCHVLANPAFGTLVSDKALGFTWAVNARENKLTPWFNDTASDNRGEMVLLRAGGRIYDAVWGAAPVFGEGFAGMRGGPEN